jgi:hypothetical protein
MPAPLAPADRRLIGGGLVVALLCALAALLLLLTGGCNKPAPAPPATLRLTEQQREARYDQDAAAAKAVRDMARAQCTQSSQPLDCKRNVDAVYVRALLKASERAQ